MGFTRPNLFYLHRFFWFFWWVSGDRDSRRDVLVRLLRDGGYPHMRMGIGEGVWLVNQHHLHGIFVVGK